MKSSTVFVMWTLMAAHSPAQSVPPPIIDMHMHALRATGQGPHPSASAPRQPATRPPIMWSGGTPPSPLCSRIPPATIH